MSAFTKPKTFESKKVLNVGVLGCTGTVGQRFIELLNNHPWFKITHIAASSRSEGKSYKEASVNWKLSSPCPKDILGLNVTLCKPEFFPGCHAIFSALDASVAGEIEEDFAKAGYAVFSNARNHRYDDDVPILLPHANPDHLQIVDHQKKLRGYTNGFIVTNANCSSTGLAIALKPLEVEFGIEKLFVTTMQAISGAGFPGVPSLDIIDNLVPLIGGEEPKMEMESQKILGACSATEFKNAEFVVSAHCNRVNVIDGHTECVSIKLKKPTTVDAVKACFNNHTSEAQKLNLPSAPPQPVVVMEEPNRPQPRLDRSLDHGYVVTVGRVRECPLFDYKFVLCSHNTVIGAAGGSILNAELAYAKGYLNF